MKKRNVLIILVLCAVAAFAGTVTLEQVRQMWADREAAFSRSSQSMSLEYSEGVPELPEPPEVPAPTNAVTPYRWSGFVFNTNRLALEPWRIDAAIANSMVDTNPPPELPVDSRETWVMRTTEVNQFITRALTVFRDGLGTNSYSSDTGEFYQWALTR